MSAQEFNEAEAIRKANEKKYTDAINTFAQKASDQRKAAWRKYQSSTVKIVNSFDIKIKKIVEKIRLLREQESDENDVSAKIAKLENQGKDIESKKQEALTKANQKYGKDIEKIAEQCVKNADKLTVPETMWKIDARPTCNERRIGEIYQQFLNPAAH